MAGVFERNVASSTVGYVTELFKKKEIASIDIQNAICLITLVAYFNADRETFLPHAERIEKAIIEQDLLLPLISGQPTAAILMMRMVRYFDPPDSKLMYLLEPYLLKNIPFMTTLNLFDTFMLKADYKTTTKGFNDFLAIYILKNFSYMSESK